eukprot:m51a1_g6739 putative eukaryotic translation initiation factor 3 (1274) ;mRNA; f:221517-226141
MRGIINFALLETGTNTSDQTALSTWAFARVLQPSYWWSPSAAPQPPPPAPEAALPAQAAPQEPPLAHFVRFIDPEPYLGDDWVVLRKEDPTAGQQQRAISAQQPMELPQGVPDAACVTVRKKKPVDGPSVPAASSTSAVCDVTARAGPRHAAEQLVGSYAVSPMSGVPPAAPTRHRRRLEPIDPAALSSARAKVAVAAGSARLARATVELASYKQDMNKSPIVVVPKPPQTRRRASDCTAALASYEARMPSAGEQFVDFVVTRSEADELFRVWHDSMWLAPGSIGESLKNASCDALFIPYWAFTGVAITKRPQADSKGYVTQKFVDYLACAVRAENDSGVALEVLAEIASWKLKGARSLAVARSLGEPMGARAGGARTVEPAEYELAWATASQALVSFMAASAEPKLGCPDGVTTFEDVAHRLLYMPVYRYRYMHDGKEYIFMVNGQSGANHGDRPYGVGSFPRTLAKFLTGAVFSVNGTRVEVVTGSKLTDIDQVPSGCYDPGAFYVVPPPSDQFLLAAATGCVELKNARGSAPVVLQAQWRGSRSLGRTYRLKPGESSVFDYSGSWCLKLLDGSPEQLDILRCETSGGGEGTDKLGMKMAGKLEMQEPKLETTFARVVVVDNIPVVPKEKLEKLITFVTRVMVTAGPLATDGVFIPTDEAGATKGYGFFEYTNEADAHSALDKLQGYKMDKNHAFRISKFDDIERYANVPEKFEPKKVNPYVEREDLGTWLEDPRYLQGAEQFLTQFADDIDIQWHLPHQTKTDLACPHKTVRADTVATWSPRGTYVTTFHVQGVMLWGSNKTTFVKLFKYPHSDVRYAALSPRETYLVTARDHGAADAQPVIVWDVKGQKALRTFLPAERSRAEEAASGKRDDQPRRLNPTALMPAPLFWSADDKYVARVVQDAVEVYEMPTFALVGGAPVRANGVQEICWSPRDSVLSYFVPERNSQPARVVLYDVRKRAELRQCNVFNVADCRMVWQSEGRYLAVRVSTVTKANKPPVTNFIVVSLEGKSITTEMIELPERVVSFAWEPAGSRLAVVHTDGAAGKTSVSFYEMASKKPVLLKKVEKKTCTDLFWSPRGGTMVLADLVSPTGIMEFFNVNDMEVMAIAEHYSTSSVEWDASGRYVAIVTSAWEHPTADSGYYLYHFTGEQMNKVLRQKFYQLKWRPRPRTLLDDKDLKQLKAKMPEFVKRFEAETLNVRSQLDAQERARREHEEKLFNDRLAKRIDEYRREARDRVLIRDGYASDNEADFVPSSTVLSEVVLDEKVVPL